MTLPCLEIAELFGDDLSRLDAESIRDAMLAVTNELNIQRPSSSPIASLGNRPVSIVGLMKGPMRNLDTFLHRSVYLPILRDQLPDALELFDAAEPSLVTGRRDTTNVPLQALYLLNSQFVQQRARSMADRLSKLPVARQVERANRLCFSRPAPWPLSRSSGGPIAYRAPAPPCRPDRYAGWSRPGSDR